MPPIDVSLLVSVHNCRLQSLPLFLFPPKRQIARRAHLCVCGMATWESMRRVLTRFLFHRQPWLALIHILLARYTAPAGPAIHIEKTVSPFRLWNRAVYKQSKILLNSPQRLPNDQGEKSHSPYFQPPARKAWPRSAPCQPPGRHPWVAPPCPIYKIRQDFGIVPRWTGRNCTGRSLAWRESDSTRPTRRAIRPWSCLYMSWFALFWWSSLYNVRWPAETLGSGTPF